MERVKDTVYPLITLAVLLAFWSFSIRWLKIPAYLLPTPTSVLAALQAGYLQGLFWPHLLFTLKATAVGYLFGCSLALILGSLLAESRTVERFTYPFIVALQSMPKVALAPLIIVWFGFGIESKIIMVALISFVPLFINTVVGIRQVNPALLDLMRAFSASRSYILFNAKLPSAAGHIFAGLQISIVLSLIGAVVAEFISSTQGLGYLIKASSVSAEVNVMFAALLSLACIGFVASQAVRIAHRACLFWDRDSASSVVARK
jgi:NitT/TauT family transport system permease protein